MANPADFRERHRGDEENKPERFRGLEHWLFVGMLAVGFAL